jgi:hypothetical protein
MGIDKHLLIGLIGYVTVFPSSFFILGSVVIDLPLIVNEIQIQRKKISFDSSLLTSTEKNLYRGTHSLFFVVLVSFLEPTLAMGVLIHQLCDWISHEGEMVTQPFFPVSKINVKEIFKWEKNV